MSYIFNTQFEISLRVLLILNTIKKNLSAERITAIDFISTYGKDFGVSEYNLHGNNSYRFSEYTVKREIIGNSIKDLVLKGYIVPHYDRNGFKYSISLSGKLFCKSLNDDYAEEFTANVNKTNTLYGIYSDRKMIYCINEYAIGMLKGD